MAEVISFVELRRARRRARERALGAQCIEIVERNLRLALLLFADAPAAERPIRARQLRQLSELLESLVEST